MRVDCYIIDDEEPAVEILRYYIQKTPDLYVKGYSHHTNGLNDLVLNECLLFLDIHLPFQSGLDFLRTQSVSYPTIITSSNEQYGVEAYNLSVVDYLLKPFSYTRFLQAIDKAKRALLAQKLGNLEEPYLIVQDNYQKQKILHKEILFIEGRKQYINIVTKNKQYMVLQSLHSVEKELEKHGFVRCHKSFIINTIHINQASRTFLSIDNRKIPIGKTYSPVALDAFKHTSSFL